MKRIKKLLKYIGVLLIISFITVFLNNPESEESKESTINDVSETVKAKPKEEKPLIKKEPKVQKLPELSYEIVKKEDISYQSTPRMVYRVVLSVDEPPKEDKMKEVAQYLWENGNTKWKEFTVFLYLPSMNTNSVAYGIGEFRPEGLLEFTVNGWALSL